MANAKHTPGPWFPVDDGGDEITILGPANKATWQGRKGSWEVATLEFDVCEVRGEDERHANARLIAAAPELLAALQLHADYEALPADRGGRLGPKGRAWADFIKARDAALAKAGVA